MTLTVSVLVFAGIGLLLMGLAVPAMRRRVPPNPLYGLRVRATFADEWVWYEANARSGRDLFVLGVAQVALALGLALYPGISGDDHALICASVLTVAVVVVAVIGWRRANRMWRERQIDVPVTAGNREQGTGNREQPTKTPADA